MIKVVKYSLLYIALFQPFNAFSEVFRQGEQPVINANAMDDSLFTRSSASAVVVPQNTRQETPELPSPMIAASQKFKEVYERLGKPRVVIYWNKILSDDIAQRQERVLDVQDINRTTNNNSRQSTSGDVAGMTVNQGDNQVARQQRTVETTYTIDNGKKTKQIDERIDAAVQSQFNSHLQTAGMRIVDRTMILRNAHLNDSKERNPQKTPDVLATEGKALHGFADILLEMELIPDAKSPFGLGFKVVGRRIADGTQVVNLYTIAVPQKVVPLPVTKYVATSKGYEKVTISSPPPAVTLPEVIAQLSAETLMQFSYLAKN